MELTCTGGGLSSARMFVNVLLRVTEDVWKFEGV